jgi:hypothetical protein
MTVALHILHIVDDYGNQIAPCDLPHEVFLRRCAFFGDQS